MKSHVRTALLMAFAAIVPMAPAGADTVEVKALSPDARCRDANKNVISPRSRPIPPFQAEIDRDSGLVSTKIGDRICYLDISEIGTGTSSPCSAAAASHPPGTEIAGTRDPFSVGGCTK